MVSHIFQLFLAMQIWLEPNVRSTETHAVGETHRLAILNGGWLHLTDAPPIFPTRLLAHPLVMHISIFSTVGQGRMIYYNTKISKICIRFI